MTLAEVAALAGRHPVTVHIAVQDGSLHTTRTKGQLTAERECVSAWTHGMKCPHMIGASNGDSNS